MEGFLKSCLYMVNLFSFYEVSVFYFFSFNIKLLLIELYMVSRII